ncbi:helicase SNF2 [Dellaglioa algida]|nr:helicase SNF2 [Dellaglioa algida]
MTRLLDDQQRAFDKLKRLKVGALFMEPGTGKTLTALTLVKSTDVSFVLFIVPFSTKNNFQKEIDKWKLNIPYEILGVETLSLSDKTYLETLERLKKERSVFMIVDESSKIKNGLAIRSQRVLQLSQLSDYRLILNGTPISKNVIDLYSQMTFLSPKILKMKETEFKDTFVEYIKVTEKVVSYNGMKKEHSKEIIKQFHNMEYLYSLISPYVFESKLRLDLAVQHINLGYSLTQEEHDYYNELKKSYLQMMTLGKDVFIQMTQLMQRSYSTSMGKVSVVKKLFKSINQRDTVIFCKFTNGSDLAKRHFPNALVLTYGKGSLGLNLQDYTNMIFWDKTFDYAQLEQAEKRIYRTGQKRECVYYHLNADVGLDGLFDNCINKKIALLEYFKKCSANEKEKLLDVI